MILSNLLKDIRMQSAYEQQISTANVMRIIYDLYNQA